MHRLWNLVHMYTLNEQKTHSNHTSSITVYPIHVMNQWNELKSKSESCAQRNKTIFVSLRNLINKTLCKLSGKMYIV